MGKHKNHNDGLRINAIAEAETSVGINDTLQKEKTYRAITFLMSPSANHAAESIEEKLNEMSECGYDYHSEMTQNIIERVLIFKKNKQNKNF